MVAHVKVAGWRLAPGDTEIVGEVGMIACGDYMVAQWGAC